MARVGTPSSDIRIRYGAYLVYWHGRLFGGLHYDLLDALDVALRLDESEPTEHEGWCALMGVDRWDCWGQWNRGIRDGASVAVAGPCCSTGKMPCASPVAGHR